MRDATRPYHASTPRLGTQPPADGWPDRCNVHVFSGSRSDTFGHACQGRGLERADLYDDGVPRMTCGMHRLKPVKDRKEQEAREAASQRAHQAMVEAEVQAGRIGRLLGGMRVQPTLVKVPGTWRHVPSGMVEIDADALEALLKERQT